MKDAVTSKSSYTSYDALTDTLKFESQPDRRS